MKGLFKKIFGIKENEIMRTSSPSEDLAQYSYQWVKTDNIGVVNEFKELADINGKEYVVFTDGSRIARELLDEFTIRVEKGFFEPVLDKTNRQARIEEARPISSHSRGQSVVATIVKDESPIAGLLKKQKENWVDVDLNLTINLPKKSLWDVMISSFDNAEEEIIEYVTKDLDIEVVRESLRKSIKDIYLQKQQIKNVRPQNPLQGQQD